MGMSISLFYFVKTIKYRYNHIVNTILRPTLFIYLLTDGLYVPLYKWIVDIYANSFYWGAILSLCIIFLCLAVGHVIAYIVEHIILRFPIGKNELCKQ